jgi:hypothetical protein
LFDFKSQTTSLSQLSQIQKLVANPPNFTGAEIERLGRWMKSIGFETEYHSKGKFDFTFTFPSLQVVVFICIIFVLCIKLISNFIA